MILEKMNLIDQFDAVVDGNLVEIPKPNPQVFVKAAELLGVPCENCIVVEDAQAGIEAAIAGNMKCIGVGNKELLGAANIVVSSTEEFNTGGSDFFVGGTLYVDERRIHRENLCRVARKDDWNPYGAPVEGFSYEQIKTYMGN